MRFVERGCGRYAAKAWDLQGGSAGAERRREGAAGLDLGVTKAYIRPREECIFCEASMSEENQSGNQSQTSVDDQASASSESSPPKPEPSFGVEKRSASEAGSQTFEKRDKSE